MSILSKKFEKQLQNLPQSPGVYFLKTREGKILYIGKATSLKSRVSSYFNQPLLDRPNLIPMMDQIAKIDYEITDSVLEALILESNLIRTKKPKYNIQRKDDKSFALILITDEDYPKVLITRQTDKPKEKIKKVFGPYTSAQTARTALKIIRRIFPYSNCKPLTGKACFYRHLRLCPGVCTGEISALEYQKIIRHLILFLEGKKSRLLKSLETEMKKASRKECFEEAATLKNQLSALKHIQDIALIKDNHLPFKGLIPERIEAYDISNILGHDAVGSMVVFTRGKIDREEYRKFKIKTVFGANDVAMLRELLNRRLRHLDWPRPDLIIVDGGKPQFNAFRDVLRETNHHIPLIAIAKGPSRKKDELLGDLEMRHGASLKGGLDKNLIKALRDEAHRFAIKYHRYLKRKGLWS